MHHPFTSPKPEDINLIDTDPEKSRQCLRFGYERSRAGGGSIRIHDKALQSRMFDLFGFTKKEAEAQLDF